MTAKAWYVANTSNGQGLVVDEQTGANVAVVYDPANAPLIASAPALLAALEALTEVAGACASELKEFPVCISNARAAIALAKGEA